MQIVLFILAAPAFAYLLWDVLGLVLGNVAKRKFKNGKIAPAATSKIAMLYPCSDDFDASACETLLKQEGVEFDFFVLDDSTQAAEQMQVDAWAAKQSRPIVVVRREDRKGYKGGNINNWLRLYGDPKKYPFLLLVDADEHLLPRFTQTLLRRIEHTDFAFVQAVHYATAELVTTFQKIFHIQVSIDQQFQMPTWNLIGIAPIIGHGVILRTTSLKQVGGFPDVVSEDLALTIKLAEVGLRGFVVSDVAGYEAFPRDYTAYWRRRRRWVQADTEMVRKFLGTVWKSKIRWLAKMWFTIRELRLPLLSTYWMLCATISALAFFGIAAVPSVSPWWWLLAPVVLIPSLPTLLLTDRPLTHRLLYLASMPVLGVATSNATLPSVAVGMRGKLRFDPTGSRAVKKTRHVDRWMLWDFFSGALFVAGGFVSGNLILFAVGLAIFASPILRTRSALPIFLGLKLAFWLLILASIWGDFSSGSMSVDHLLLMAALSFS